MLAVVPVALVPEVSVVEVSVVGYDPGYVPDVPELEPSQAQAEPAPESASTAIDAVTPTDRFALYITSPFSGCRCHASLDPNCLANV